ncbi:MAG: hypothetical protein M3081_22230 [Gemmatimonadota bacterium]|nr:hypothetical protein [Gemmatimonadota bacterium]
MQPKVRGGDRSPGNLVSACRGCNTLKGHQRLARFLADHADARRNFFECAIHVWPRHLRSVREEMEQNMKRRRAL